MLDANDALVRILGYPSRESLMEVNVREMYVDPADRHEWQVSMEGASGASARSFEARLRRFDGSVIWVRFSLQAFRDDEARIMRYEGALEDVTARRQAEEALRAARNASAPWCRTPPT